MTSVAALLVCHVSSSDDLSPQPDRWNLYLIVSHVGTSFAWLQTMHIEAQIKKLAQNIFLFSASSLCVILLCLAATAWHNAPAPRFASSPIYTYQNPFSTAGNASATVLTDAKTAGFWDKLTSAKFLLGLSGLGVLWLASTWYLQNGWRTKKQRVYQKINHVTPNSPAKMNPLAVLPERVAQVPKEDTIHSTVFCGTTTLYSLAHRKATAPCQSRFRPVTLVSKLTNRRNRFGRL